MEKRLFKTVPVPKPDYESMHKIAIAEKGKRGILTAQKKRIKGEETLILNVYQVSGKNKRDISLQFRMFCQKEDYITLDADTGRWRTGALLKLVCRDYGWAEYWWDYEQLEFLTDKDALIAEKTFRKFIKSNEEYEGRAAFQLLNAYQNHIKQERLFKKHKKITDLIDADMKKFGELPSDYQEFVEEKVFGQENYIFYSTEHKRAYCTGCRNNFILENKHLRHETIGIWNNEDEVKHNRTVRCPYCNKYLQAKSEGMSRQSLISVAWSVLVQKHGEEVLTRYFCHTKDFRLSYSEPKIITFEGYRTVHTSENVKDYMWDRFKSTNVMRWCEYRDRGTCWFPAAETVAPRCVTMYNDTLQEVVEGTCMKYSVPDIFIEQVLEKSRYFKSPWIIDNYFNSYRKHPFIEQLLKVGFYKMVEEFLSDSYCNKLEFNHGCNSVLGTLGVNKYQFNMLRRLGNPRMRDLEILRYKPDLKWEDFNNVRYIHDNGHVDMYKKFIDFMQYTTIHKLTRYMTEQKIKHENDYFDYAGWLEAMGYDMRNEFNLFPRDFRKAHDEMSKQYIKFKDKQAREEVKRFNRLLKKLQKETADVEAMNLAVEDLFIRLPNKLEELKKEGEALHHCVGTYMERVKQGKTMIFFIRRRSEPDKSFYTLEWKGRVVQCRGSHNCDMTPEVKAFVTIFESKMQEYESAPAAKRRKVG
ncbi:MAG: PcfJ domain-containing protein [Clostridiaceae bacterium]|nr:PcfJ domain-containing protein [Clostridiaceae bacterium]